MKYLILVLVLVLLAVPLIIVNFTQTHTVFAANTGDCFQLNNGGITDRQFCPTPIPTQAGQAPSNQTNSSANQTPTQTKGGQTIYPVSQSKTTPSTGPETWAIVALIPLGGIGMLLRNKAKI